MTVTTLADVEAALVRSVTAAELTHVVRIMEMVEADVLGRLPGYDLEPAGAETVTIGGTYSKTLTLPSYPVTAVASVSVDGTALTGTEYQWTTNGLLTRLPWTGYPLGGTYYYTWGDPSLEVEVTYTHGQAGDPPLVLVIAELVAARLTGAGRQGVTSMSIDTAAYSETYDHSVRTTIADVDWTRLAPYARTTGLVA